jgi:hypothetical protein
MERDFLSKSSATQGIQHLRHGRIALDSLGRPKTSWTIVSLQTSWFLQ